MRPTLRDRFFSISATAFTSATLTVLLLFQPAKAGWFEDLQETVFNFPSNANREVGAAAKNVGKAVEKGGQDLKNEAQRFGDKTGITGPKIGDADPTGLFLSVLPICWFGSQCWDDKDKYREKYSSDNQKSVDRPYYSVLRIYCIHSATRNEDGFVDIQANSSISVEGAEEYAKSQWRSEDRCRKLKSNSEMSSKPPMWLHPRLAGSIAQ